MAKRPCVEAAALLDGAAGGLREIFGREELEALAHRKGWAASVAARLAAKDAVREALLDAGLSEEALPPQTGVRVFHDAYGKPVVDLPGCVASWLSLVGLGVEISLTHTGDLAAAVVVIAPRR